MNNKKKKGITMIALIVTVIVLIILAGVTMNALKSDRDLNVIDEAKRTKDDTMKAQEKEILTAILVSLKNKDTSKMTDSDKMAYIKNEAAREGLNITIITNRLIIIQKREYTYKELINVETIKDIY